MWSVLCSVCGVCSVGDVSVVYAMCDACVVCVVCVRACGWYVCGCVVYVVCDGSVGVRVSVVHVCGVELFCYELGAFVD